MKNNVFLVGYYNAGNLGDQILMEESVELVQREKKTARFYILSNGINERNINNCKYVNKYNLLNVSQAIMNSSYIVYGGGSIFQDSSSALSLLYYSAILFIAKILNKKVYLLAQGIGPFRCEISTMLAKVCYRLADHVSIREGQQNIDYLQKWNIQNYIQTADLAWGRYCEYDGEEKESILVSLRHSSDLSEKWLQDFAVYLDKKHKSKKIILLAMQEDDKEVLIRLEQLLSNEDTELIYPETSQDLDLTVSKCSTAYCMRYHALLFAIKHEIQCMGISYDMKVSGLCKEASLECFDLNQFQDSKKAKNADEEFLAKQIMKLTDLKVFS